MNFELSFLHWVHIYSMINEWMMGVLAAVAYDEKFYN